jgi:hypothetical protein
VINVLDIRNQNRAGQEEIFKGTQEYLLSCCTSLLLLESRKGEGKKEGDGRDLQGNGQSPL